MLALGYSMLANIELRERARPYMQELAEQAGVTVALGARDRLAVVYMAVCSGAQIITISRNVGDRLPIQSTSIGRAILATLPAAERDYLMRALRERDPAGYPAAKANVDRAIEELATQGFCTGFGDWIADVNAVAAPILSDDGQSVYAMNVGGPSFMISKEHLTEDLGPRLARITQDLTAPILPGETAGRADR